MSLREPKSHKWTIPVFGHDCSKRQCSLNAGNTTLQKKNHTTVTYYSSHFINLRLHSYLLWYKRNSAFIILTSNQMTLIKFAWNVGSVKYKRVPSIVPPWWACIFIFEALYFKSERWFLVAIVNLFVTAVELKNNGRFLVAFRLTWFIVWQVVLYTWVLIL